MSCTSGSNAALGPKAWASGSMGSMRAGASSGFLWIYQGKGTLACTVGVFLGPEPERCTVFLALGYRFISFLQNHVFPEISVFQMDCLQSQDPSIHPCICASIFASVYLCIQPAIHTLVFPSIHPTDIFIEHLLWDWCCEVTSKTYTVPALRELTV